MLRSSTAKPFSDAPRLPLASSGLGVDELVHDLRQELAVVRHLLERLHGASGEQQSATLALLRAQVEAVDDVVLSAVRERSVEHVDVPGLVGDVVEAARAAFDVRLEVHATPAPPVVADPVLLRRVLLNLVVNACEAAPGGAVVVRTGAADGTTWVTVADDGPSARDAVDDTAGLGSWVVHAVVRDAGGTVERHADVPHGRLVRVRLPSAGRP